MAGKKKLIDEIADLIGRQNAIVLTRRFGGRTLSVPTTDNLGDNHPLVFTIGLEPARAMARMYGGTVVDIPTEVNALLDQRNAEIVRRFMDDEESIRSLAFDFGLDRAMIAKIIDKAGHRELRISRSLTYT